MDYFTHRDELEKRGLSHTVQLLKLELSQKQLLLETVRSETGGQLEELREQLADAQHGKRLATLRLQSMTHAYEQEMSTLREKNRVIKNELEAKQMQVKCSLPYRVLYSTDTKIENSSTKTFLGP